MGYPYEIIKIDQGWFRKPKYILIVNRITTDLISLCDDGNLPGNIYIIARSIFEEETKCNGKK